MAVAFASQFLAAKMSPERSAGSFVGINTLVEGFMTDGRLAFDLEERGNLLRAPPLGQLGLGKSPGRRTLAALGLRGT